MTQKNKSNSPNDQSDAPEKTVDTTYRNHEKPSYDHVKILIRKSGIILPILISLGVFVVEALIMGFIRIIPGLSLQSQALIDAGILLVFLFPLLFFLMFRPLIRSIHRQERLQAELEIGIREKTRELQTSNVLLQHEIQNRKKIEKEINVERERLFSVLDGLPASVHLVGPDHTIRFSNRYFREHFGYETSPCYKVLHGLDKPCTVCHASDVFQQQYPDIYEEIHRDSRLYRIHNYPFVDTDGSKLVLQLGIDITKQKEAENALRYSENRFRLLVNSINDTVFTLDKSMRITELYGDLTAKLGVTPEFYIGKCVSEVFDSDTTKIHEESIRKVFSGQHTIYEWESNFPEGKRFIQSSLAPIVDANSQIEGVVGVARDITSKKILEKQIIETEKLLAVAQMSAMISHEFRNSLTSVRMILELLLEATPDNKSLNVALSSVTHMEQIVSQLLRFSRPAPITLKPDNLYRILQESIELVSGQINKNKISLKLSLIKNLPELPLDALYLKEAIVNLLLNAIQSISMGGKPDQKREIRIISKQTRIRSLSYFNEQDLDTKMIQDRPDHKQFKPAQFQIVEISDTGTGIKPEHVKQIFDPFFTTKTTGTGLGLTAVKRAIDAHHGFIQTKTRPGRGTRFIIYLPQEEKVNQ